MQQVGHRMDALSLHYYTVKGWSGSKGSATEFTTDEYYTTIAKCLGIETVLQRHCQIMDTYDPEKRILLFVDEWGTWFDEEPGTIAGHLYQQNTMRDAMVAALSFNTFHRYTDRIGMTNIAQVVNVLQAMILTRGDSMLLTPTYHVFTMYRPHQGATYIPTVVQTEELRAADGAFAAVPKVSATASRDSTGVLHLSIVNTSTEAAERITVRLPETYRQGTKIAAATLHTHDCPLKNRFLVRSTYYRLPNRLSD